MPNRPHKPWGYRWRSSKAFIVSTVVIALFTETFLYGFIVPILSYMLESRLEVEASQTQRLTTALLSAHGFVALISAPIIAHFTDKTPNRKIPLIVSLAACLAGTFVVACTPSIWALFVGRILQGVAGAAAWIVCFATLTDNFNMEHMGKVMGIMMSFVMAGVVAGPMTAGFLLQLVGYWAAWSVPLIVLLFDLFARLIMVEKQDPWLHFHDSSATRSSSFSSGTTDVGPQDEETSPLLTSASPDYRSVTPSSPIIKPRENTSSRGFYCTVFWDTRVWASLANSVAFYSIISGFNATLPLHLRSVFDWGSMPVSMMFLALQVPSLLLSPLVGWLRDRFGLRYPTMVGWLLMAPLLWLLSIPGEPQFPWANAETNGKTIFVSCMMGIGIISTLTRGAEAVQMAAVMNDIQFKSPEILGAHGASSRTFSMTESSFSLGLMVGPLLSGSLSEAIGYYYANITLAALCLAVSLLTFCFFDSKHTGVGTNQKDTGCIA